MENSGPGRVLQFESLWAFPLPFLGDFLNSLAGLFARCEIKKAETNLLFSRL
jgi:hypothetical protein